MLPFLRPGTREREREREARRTHPVLEHFDHDVGAADELAVNVELGNGGPVGVGFDALPDGLVCEYIEGLELCVARLQHLLR